MYDTHLFSICSKFHAYFRNDIKNAEKVFYFLDNGVGTRSEKLCKLQREYLLPAVTVSTNGPKISDQTKTDFFQVNISQMHEKIG